MMNIRLATENRKAAALRLAEITGETSRYTKVPRCAYQVGPYFFEKDGTVTVTEDADLQPLRTLAEEGLLEPFETEAEPQAQEETYAPDDRPVEEQIRERYGSYNKGLSKDVTSAQKERSSYYFQTEHLDDTMFN